MIMRFRKDKAVQANAHRWHQPIDSSENIIGINDSSYYTFRDARYEGLAREILQNSLDEQLKADKPVKVEFSLIEAKTRNLPDYDNYKRIFEAGLKSWENDSQPNGKRFFQEGLKALGQETIKIMRISDFNTNGVLGSQKANITSAHDITPWYNLLKSEGSSSKGDTQGGSFGIGKNATFANSILRTVFYSTYDRENIKGYEGVAKLATIFKGNDRYSAKCYFGNIVNERSNAIEGLFALDEGFQRDEYGTDIYILGFEDDALWDIRMIKTILSDFIIPIYNKDLEINMDGEIIDKDTIYGLYDKYIELCINNRRKRYANEIQSSKNYYEVLTSQEAKEFTYKFDQLGNARLRVLYNPDFERKILRTRKTGMKLFDEGGISSSIGFSGIVTLEGDELNKLFRDMENPAHTKWSADNISDPRRRKIGEDSRRELNKWMKKMVIDNATDKKAEDIEVLGLDEYLPADLLKNPEDERDLEKEMVSSKISEVSIRRPSREDVKKQRYSSGSVQVEGSVEEGGPPGEGYSPKGNDSEDKGGKGRGEDIGLGQGSQIKYKKIRKDYYSPRLIDHEGLYRLNIKFNKELKNAILKIFISGESMNVDSKIRYAMDYHTNSHYEFTGNIIKIGDISKEEVKKIVFELEHNNNYSLEVEIYEGK